MNRSEIYTTVEPMPMLIKTQQEADGAWVAVLPGIQLSEITVTGLTETGAIHKLRKEMNRMWQGEEK